MENLRKTKKCPFCGEQILFDAVKCRFCKEFIEEDTDQIPQSHHAVGRSRPGTEDSDDQERKPYKPESGERFTPSMFGLAGTILWAVVFAAFLIVILLLPYAQLLEKYFSIPADQVITVVRFIHLACFFLILLSVLNVLYKAFELKSTRYDVSTDRIEWTRGIFSRHVDNIDMFRIVDIKMQRTLIDCILGIGTVIIVTKDETDPYFEFEKVRNPKKLYDILKVQSLQADRKQGVIHID